MYRRSVALLLLALASTPLIAADRTSIRIVLVGDSTVTDDAGWGTGLADLLTGDIECINMAKGGRSSRSFRSEGWWQKSLDLKPDYLLIQFGHNDQPGKGPNRESAADGDFRDHLRRYVDEARDAGSKPVLITSLTRRRWNQQQQIEPTLADYAKATTVVAAEKQVPLIDLHQLSIEQCNRIGPEGFRIYEPMTARGADHTHLNAEGSRAVGRIVAAELIRVVPELTGFVNQKHLKPTAQADLGRSHNDVSGLKLQHNEKTVSIHSGDRQILVYNKVSPPVPEGISSDYRRSGFLHPVASPDGRVVTATFPKDHPHQHGIFSAWVRSTWNDRNIDFWNLAGGTGRVLHQRVVSTFCRDDGAGFEIDLVHRATQDPAVDILRERWKVTVYPTDGQYHCFDLETTQSAITDIPLVVNEYHYGGIALRGLTRWVQLRDKDPRPDRSEPVEHSDFLNDLGSDRVAGNHQKARWVALAGSIDGAPVSITVLCHPDNFRAPQAARLHPTKPYFCFAPCVEGSFTIDQKHPFKGRYRYLVTDAEPDAAWLNQQWQSWSSK
ncbi:MAG: PmoA family protein [Fuerstiella sp.]